jgi:hypothetical protein
MTECNQSSFGFEANGRREIVARFDGGTISSDGGAFLLHQRRRHAVVESVTLRGQLFRTRVPCVNRWIGFLQRS